MFTRKSYHGKLTWIRAHYNSNNKIIGGTARGRPVTLSGAYIISDDHNVRVFESFENFLQNDSVGKNLKTERRKKKRQINEIIISLNTVL